MIKSLNDIQACDLLLAIKRDRISTHLLIKGRDEKSIHVLSVPYSLNNLEWDLALDRTEDLVKGEGFYLRASYVFDVVDVDIVPSRGTPDFVYQTKHPLAPTRVDITFVPRKPKIENPLPVIFFTVAPEDGFLLPVPAADIKTAVASVYPPAPLRKKNHLVMVNGVPFHSHYGLPVHAAPML